MLERTADPDLPLGLWRKNDSTICTADGRDWRYVRRRDLRDLTDDEWQRAVLVLRRPPSGWLPCGAEGAFLGNLLRDLGPTSLAALLPVVRQRDEQPEQYVARAVRDKRAHLALLVPVQR